MEIVVRGKNRSVPSRLQTTARAKVERIARYAHDVSRVEVDFSQARNPRIGEPQLCEITVRLTGHFVKAHAAAIEPEAALDLALDKVEHQVSRIKDKRIARSHPRRRDVLDGRAADTADSIETEADDTDTDTDGDARIVKTKLFGAKPMDPQDAALQMDLLGHDFFVFTNTETGQAAVIYRRRDGHLGLIDTSG